MENSNFSLDYILTGKNNKTINFTNLQTYFELRSNLLNNSVRSNLMDVTEAEKLYKKVRKEL